MLRDHLFDGKRFLVTGGGTGLGKAMTARLLELGATVYICGRRGPVLDATAAELTARHGGRVLTRVVDIRDAAAVDAMAQSIFDEGPLDGLVNNAAGNFVSRTEDLSPRGFNAISDIVFRGTFYVTQAVGRRWISGGHPGAVVSIIVTWVRTGSPFVVPSAMSKAGIDAMTKSLAVEWGRYGIRLNAIAPGVIPTEGASKRLRPTGGIDAAARNPMKRVGRLDEIGNLCGVLLSDECGWINGETIALDGGDWLANGAYFTEYLAWDDAQWADARAKIEAQNAKDRAGRS